MKTRKQIIELFNALSQASMIGNAKFKYAALKNLRTIDSEIETLRSIEKDIAGTIAEYNDRQNDIIKQYGTAQPDGNIAVTKDSENYEATTKAIEDLKVEYKEALNEFEQKQADYIKLLEEEIEFDFKLHEVIIDNVPDEFGYIKLFMDFNIIK